MRRVKVDPDARQHGSVYPGPSSYQDARYAEVVERNIKDRAEKRKKEKEAAA